MHEEPKTRLEKLKLCCKMLQKPVFKANLNRGMNQTYQTTHTKEHLHEEILSMLKL